MSSPLRIIQVVNVRWFNATAWYGFFLAGLLREAGHEVISVALPGTESFARAEAWGLQPQGLDLTAKNPFAYPALLAAMAKLVRSFRPHIINCHRAEAFMLWGLLRNRAHNFALIRTRGDQRPPKPNWANRLIHTRLADELIVTNSAMARSVRDMLQVPPSRIHTIFGGVDTRRFHPGVQGRSSMRAAWGLRDDELAVGILGRFDHVKGQKELISAFAMLKRQGYGTVRLVLAGFPTGISRSTIEGWVRDAGLEGSAVITGRCDDVQACISAFDLGVIASLGSETIARAALEIMACGVPLVSTRVGVMPDLVGDEALVPPGDSQALADVIRRYCDDSEYGPRLRAAQGLRMAELTGGDFLCQTLAVYYGAVQKRGIQAHPV